MKIAKEWLQLLDGCFLIITGYSMLDASLTLATYSLSELLTIDKIGSVVVSIVAVLFWVLRAYQSIKKHKKEQDLLNLEIDIKKMYINRKDMQSEIDKLLKNDK